eukprot:Blabericola_migrator_1__6303@NODE_3180_length_1973_cov_5_251836_g1988_i0_p2_GENE_NODE_3180_length_1973_cov_5_251836_g1988_i0NODE_3180_length_1973_cov_5_251836_g1988_i0_p2_ORF_typecomplete_len140_score18_33_NODE_3180_length_1973_cov_5_251836_g1988_i0212631
MVAAVVPIISSDLILTLMKAGKQGVAIRYVQQLPVNTDFKIHRRLSQLDGREDGEAAQQRQPRLDRMGLLIIGACPAQPSLPQLIHLGASKTDRDGPRVRDVKKIGEGAKKDRVFHVPRTSGEQRDRISALKLWEGRWK